MAFPDIFKLTKLKIQAFSDDKRQKEIKPAFEAMFNPGALTQEFALNYIAEQTVAGTSVPARVQAVPPGRMTVPLLIDGTGVTEIGLLNLFAPPPTVEDQIAAFKKLAYDVNGDIHTPNFLRLVYGDNIKFDCLLSKLTITRQSFDRDGSAVRAQLDVELIHDVSADAALREHRFSSPDVSHSLRATAGDTLPLLADRIYGAPDRHLELARFNGINHPRALNPGTPVLFPPLPR